MRARAWKAYLLFGLLGGIAYYFIPPLAKSGPFFNVLGASSVAAILIGTRMNRPGRRLPWFLFAAGQAFFISGDVITYNYARFFHHEIPFPSIGDVFYLSVYPCLIAGILVIAKHRSPGRDRESLIDSLIITIGAALLSWEFLMAPYARDHTLTLLVKVMLIAYPLMDILLLGVVVRLAVAGGRRPAAFYLLVFGSVALLATDAAYGLIQVSGVVYQNGGPLEAGWLSFYVLWAAAALHPSMRQLSERTPKAPTTFGRARLPLLAGASLMAPAVQIMQVLRGEPVDSPVVIGGSIALFILAIARMSGLISTHERAENRERVLRHAGAGLVAATDRDGMYLAAIHAARDLVGSACDVVLAVRGEAEPSFRVVAEAQRDAEHDPGTDENPPSSSPLPSLPLPAAMLDRFADRGWAEVGPEEADLRTAMGLPIAGTWLAFAPVRINGDLHALLEVSGRAELAPTTLDALAGLASQVALALESELLTEDLMRRRSEARFASLVRNSSDVVTIIEADTTIRYQSPSIMHVLGYDPGSMVGGRLLDFVHPDDAAVVVRHLADLEADQTMRPTVLEFRWRHHDDSWREVEALCTNLAADPEVGGIVLNTRDVSERKAFERQLAHQAFHDSTTGLANRALFRDRVEHALARQQRDDRTIAVVFLDVDDFKTINDSFGHAVGDQVLTEIGRRLSGTLRAADTAARLGGDEFGVLLEDAGYERAVDVAERVMDALEVPFRVEDKELFIRASLGIAVGDDDRKGKGGAEEILRNADIAMYTAKTQGKGRYQVFEPRMHASVLARLELKADLQRAVDRGEFVLEYQPVVVLATGAIHGVEALVRWRHPTKGLVPPNDFIPLAEETGLIVKLGEWVLHEACRMGAELQRDFPRPEPLTMSVNLSPRQLQDPSLLPVVESALAAAGIPPASLTLEITETAMMHDADIAILRLNQLRDLGVKLAIDDFGTGYSSLNYLRSFPVDILKVDRSFVKEIAHDNDQSVLTASIIELAGSLNLRPVAEGVERDDQLARLMAMHCEFGQGFLFARPLASEQLRELLSTQAGLLGADANA